MTEGMPNFNQLNKMQEDIQRMLSDVTKKQKEGVDNVIKLRVTPQSQKSMKVNGVDVLVQLYEGDVRVVFPTKDLTKQYYDEIERGNQELDKVMIRCKKAEDNYSDIWIRNKRLIQYTNLPFYKRLISFDKWVSK